MKNNLPFSSNSSSVSISNTSVSQSAPPPSPPRLWKMFSPDVFHCLVIIDMLVKFYIVRILTLSPINCHLKPQKKTIRKVSAGFWRQKLLANHFASSNNSCSAQSCKSKPSFVIFPTLNDSKINS
jgi:hypothetical protein